MTTKICRDCKIEKPAKDFPANKRLKSGLGTYCRKCQQARTVASPNFKDNVRKSSLKRNFGITIEEYDDILDRQNGRCAICKQIDTERGYLSVDHNHETNKVRGLLCQQCNLGLGKFKDNQEYLANAVWYLETHKQL